jgi:hypothetical protein
MPCIILKSPQGERLVEQGKPYKRLPGEERAGIDWQCGAPVAGARQIVFRKCSSCGEKGVYEYT